jgi:hypothetical protein
LLSGHYEGNHHDKELILSIDERIVIMKTLKKNRAFSFSLMDCLRKNAFPEGRLSRILPGMQDKDLHFLPRTSHHDRRGILCRMHALTETRYFGKNRGDGSGQRQGHTWFCCFQTILSVRGETALFQVTYSHV